jgi:hypothetical protein
MKAFRTFALALLALLVVEGRISTAQQRPPVAECSADQGMTRDARGNCVFDNRACYVRCMGQYKDQSPFCRQSCKYNGN